jgi:hypothetical protein
MAADMSPSHISSAICTAKCEHRMVNAQRAHHLSQYAEMKSTRSNSLSSAMAASVREVCLTGSGRKNRSRRGNRSNEIALSAIVPT